ncbi:hypothetical protein [Mycobacterium kansasii]
MNGITLFPGGYTLPGIPLGINVGGVVGDPVPPPPGPPLPVGPPGTPPPPPPGPPLPDGPPGAGDVSDGGMLDGAVVDVVVVVVDGVVLLVGPLLSPPPQATAMTSMAPPPKTANAVLAGLVISFSLSVQGFRFKACAAYPQLPRRKPQVGLVWPRDRSRKVLFPAFPTSPAARRNLAAGIASASCFMTGKLC